MNFKRNLAKISAATAFALTGVVAVNNVTTHTTVHAADFPSSVRINYVSGYGINVWSNYSNPVFTGKRLAHGTTVNVVASATDANGKTWYKVGSDEWIPAEYTVDANIKQMSSTTMYVNYVAGYGINVWSSYNNPSFTGKRLAHGTSVNVVASATDANGKTWYSVGANEWVPAEYLTTVNPSASSSSSNTTQSTTSAAAKVVSLASAQLGKAYVWGANGPSAFDCSGLVNYVYSQVGLSLGRTTYVQVNNGTTVSMNNLQPGDLLFWGSASAPYHVGIYVGNGQYIHAATPSQGVIKQSISQYFYPSVAKRVL